jgi:hypothetical protein
MKRYELCVAAIFKNESLNLKEWIEHYIFHGADHIYLVNDNSSDDYIEVLSPYINKNIVTLFDSDVSKFSNRQQVMYDKYILPKIKDSQWTIICDLDEFWYSPKEIDLKNILNKYKQYDAIYANWAMFHSNGNIKHPKSIVQSCTVRHDLDGEMMCLVNGRFIPSRTSSRKYIINGDAQINGLWVHDPIGNFSSINASYLGQEDYDLIINHYTTQSIEFWEKVKMKRGDVNNHHPDDARDWEYFKHLNIGEIEDTTLSKQNKKNI